MSITVAFNARLLSSPSLRGWNRYSINLIEELALLGLELHLYTDRPPHGNHLARLSSNSVHIETAPPMNYLQWEQIWLPARCRKNQVSVLHTPFHFGLPWFSPCPRVLTLHDAIGHSPKNGIKNWPNRFRLGLRQPGAIVNAIDHWVSRRRAEHIITVSEHSRRELLKAFAISPKRISVISEAADPMFHRPPTEANRREVLRKFSIRDPYFLYVGGWEARKNIPFLLRAFAKSSASTANLVIGGGSDEQHVDMSNLVRDLGINDRVSMLGHIEDVDLPALYAEALAFVYPSRDEGFGLQLCEAMAIGCAVLAANGTSLPEVLGSGGELFTLESTDELSHLLSQVAYNAELRRELQVRAKVRSESFRWSRTAFETLALYKALTLTV